MPETKRAVYMEARCVGNAKKAAYMNRRTPESRCPPPVVLRSGVLRRPARPCVPAPVSSPTRTLSGLRACVPDPYALPVGAFSIGWQAAGNDSRQFFLTHHRESSSLGSIFGICGSVIAYGLISKQKVICAVGFGWGTWIRTTTNRFRVCRPTVRRFPSGRHHGIYTTAERKVTARVLTGMQLDGDRHLTLDASVQCFSSGDSS